jgi:predicted metal-dependent hydrolase
VTFCPKIGHIVIEFCDSVPYGIPPSPPFMSVVLATPSSLFHVEFGETRYPIAIRRHPRSKRLSLRLSRATGEMVLTMPQRASLSSAHTFAQAYAGWIAARLQKQPQTIPLNAGSVFPLRGISTLIVNRPRVPGGVMLTMGEDGGSQLHVSGDASHVPRRVKDYLKKQALHDITLAVKHYEAKSGLKSSRITLRDTVSRWGSCSSAKALNFSWRLIMAPPLVLDYLTAHEVTHLKEMNHSPRYWALLNLLCPHVDEAEAWLKKHGVGLHRFK